MCLILSGIHYVTNYAGICIQAYYSVCVYFTCAHFDLKYECHLESKGCDVLLVGIALLHFRGYVDGPVVVIHNWTSTNGFYPQ